MKATFAESDAPKAALARLRALWIVLASAIAGLLFAPVFGLRPLLLPIAVVLVACYGAVELCIQVKVLQPWRPLTMAVLGLFALSVTMFGSVDVTALAAGVTDSWQLTLQSTWPVRPDAELMFFVPLLVLLAAVIGIELLRWPAVALVPAVAVLVLSQAFVALTGVTAVLAALGFAVVAAGLYMPVRPGLVLIPTVVLGLVGAAVVTVVDTGEPYSLQQSDVAQVPLPRTISPLTEVAARLSNPETPVFSYTTTGPVDRWRLVVLNQFNGVSWEPDDNYRRLGSQVGPSTGAQVREYTAKIKAPEGQWLPSQSMPASVTGTAPLIDQSTGALLVRERKGALQYDLSWWEPQVDDDLSGAALSSSETPGPVGEIPPGIEDLARKATGGGRPSFRTALVLEQYLRGNYNVATGTELPTGSGWPQLREFLLESKRGTSEQFAASYVALARIVGIPVRLAVGYRAPQAPAGAETVVHNRDVLAWPEIAVAGIGWVPLDPVGGAAGAGPAPSRLAQITAKARADLPPPSQLPEQPLPPRPPEDEPGGSINIWFIALAVLVALAVLLVLAILAIPLGKAIRTLRRKRQTGANGVVAAWWEARDLLRAYGTRVTPGMTARDLARASTDGSIVDSLTGLATQMDVAMWSGMGTNDSLVAEAWTSVNRIRKSLAGRPLAERFRAVFAIR
ncbi:DUF3488 and transglutaminase-like domain-containing protein [Kibdelosporangium philippinense]|uniref:DUF3488 and transglutaminase-like domain-containing protein n=1 Tax=Kibdelosporangium philippinense TaxID=211113 RepID=A0ABS8ZFN0_9PSEU|nr:DUF3488 and transglutaminase-like domain-containing protein [Kibdelosporangium philippinense]MCE7006638.1 DUF3488 and transglutaminase-like domain-containing protein [Kibdelosporangium philippinense]